MMTPPRLFSWRVLQRRKTKCGAPISTPHVTYVRDPYVGITQIRFSTAWISPCRRRVEAGASSQPITKLPLHILYDQCTIFRRFVNRSPLSSFAIGFLTSREVKITGEQTQWMNSFFVDSEALSQEALEQKHRLEQDSSSRRDPMEYLPGMERIESEVMAPLSGCGIPGKWPWQDTGRHTCRSGYTRHCQVSGPDPHPLGIHGCTVRTPRI